MKLVEEIGEVAEVLNKRDGRKVNDSDDIQVQLAYELVDVIHYATAIAALNGIDISSSIIEKDRKASMKYHHDKNMESFLAQKNADKDEVYQFMKYE